MKALFVAPTNNATLQMSMTSETDRCAAKNKLCLSIRRSLQLRSTNSESTWRNGRQKSNAATHSQKLSSKALSETKSVATFALPQKALKKVCIEWKSSK